MPKVGFYAVRVGRTIGVYNSWEECSDQTHGYPNARYKRFNNLKEAEDFVHGNISSTLLPPGDLVISKGRKRSYPQTVDVDAEDFGWDIVYCDGACKRNGTSGSVGGIGVWWGPGDPRNIAERCPGAQTNNRAELIAILRVLESTPFSKTPLTIKTDSQYSINCLKKWIQKWKKNDWKSAANTAVKNEEIIRCIDSHLAIRSKWGQNVRLQHVNGHSGEVGNEGADCLATAGTLEPLIPERDWAGLEAQLERVLDGINPSTVFTGSMEVRGSTESTPLEIHTQSQELGSAVVLFDNQPDMAPSRSHPKANSSVWTEKAVCGTPMPAPCNDLVDAQWRNEAAGQERFRTLDKVFTTSSNAKSFSCSELQTANEATLVSSIHAPVIQLAENSKKPLAVSESQNTQRMELGSSPTEKPSHHFNVFATDRSMAVHQSTAQRPTTQEFQRSPTQSPVKVLYVAPPLVPVAEEDVNFDDYVDCLLDDADLALELVSD